MARRTAPTRPDRPTGRPTDPQADTAQIAAAVDQVKATAAQLDPSTITLGDVQALAVQLRTLNDAIVPSTTDHGRPPVVPAPARS